MIRGRYNRAWYTARDTSGWMFQLQSPIAAFRPVEGGMQITLLPLPVAYQTPRVRVECECLNGNTFGVVAVDAPDLGGPENPVPPPQTDARTNGPLQRSTSPKP